MTDQSFTPRVPEYPYAIEAPFVPHTEVVVIELDNGLAIEALAATPLPSFKPREHMVRVLRKEGDEYVVENGNEMIASFTVIDFAGFIDEVAAR